MKQFRTNLLRTCLALACGGIVALHANIAMMPELLAQDIGTPYYPLCVAGQNPCGSACPNSNNSECRFNLNGWTWGSCDKTKFSSKKCYSGTFGCGDEFDCSGNYIGPCNGSGNPYCTNG